MTAISQRPHITVQIPAGSRPRVCRPAGPGFREKRPTLTDSSPHQPKHLRTPLVRKPWRIAKADWRSGQAMEWETTKTQLQIGELCNGAKRPAASARTHFGFIAASHNRVCEVITRLVPNSSRGAAGE